MSRRPAQSIVANPVLVGAVTTLVVIVAVFLAYNANSGLPFVPTREFKIQISDGSNLVKGNEVREGGYRVGVVESLTPMTMEDGKTIALLGVKLDKTVGEIPADTRITIRPRSALGLKYVEVERGTSKQMLRDGDTIKIDKTNVPVQFDDVYSIFDEKTRESAQRNLDGFGNAFAGRGQSLNRAIGDLPELFKFLAPVARNLASNETNITRFFKELGDTARIVAPLSKTQVSLFRNMAITFEAFSRDPGALQETIRRSPETLAVSEDSLRVQRPFLNDVADFSGDLRVAARELRVALPIINPALERGAPVLRRSVALNEDLQDVFRALRDLTTDPKTEQALRALTATVTTLNPQLRYLGPFVTVCNDWNYFWTYVADHFAENDPTGQSQRALLNSTAGQDNDIADAGVAEPANGEGYTAAAARRGDPVFLQGQPYGAAITDQGLADCEAGQRGYLRGPLAAFAAPRFRIVGNPHTPGAQGPTFTGKPRVPAGQTFTRHPETGAQLPPQLRTP